MIMAQNQKKEKPKNVEIGVGLSTTRAQNTLSKIKRGEIIFKRSQIVVGSGKLKRPQAWSKV